MRFRLRRFQGEKLLGLASSSAAVALSLGEGLSGVAALLVAFAALQGLVRREGMRFWHAHTRSMRDALNREPLLVCLIVLVVAGLLPLAGGGVAAGAQGLARLVPIAIAVLAAFACAQLSPAWRRRVAVCFCIGAAGAALFGLVQYLFDARPGEFIARTDAFIADQALVPGSTRSVAGGFYFHRLKLAHLLVLAIGPCGASLVTGSATRRERWVAFFALLLYASALALTFARGALLAVGAGALALIFQASAHRRKTAFALLFLLALPLIFHPGARARVRSASGAEARAVRALIWSEATRIIRDYPAGCGWGQYRETVRPYYQVSSPHFRTVTLPHNVFLAVWAETGPLGLASYLLVWTLLFFYAWQGRKKKPFPAASMLYFVASFWTLASTHDVFFHQVIGMAYGAFGGWTAALMGERLILSNRERRL